MGHSKFKFKNVGNKFTDRKFDNSTVTKVVNIGIKTPLRNSGNSEIFDMHTDPRDQVKDNLKNLILTNQGERLGMYAYGANLKNILYDFSNEKKYLELVKQSINNAAQKYMPMVAIQDIQTVVLNRLEKQNANLNGLAKLKIRVIFTIPLLLSEQLGIDVEMYIGG